MYATEEKSRIRIRTLFRAVIISILRIRGSRSGSGTLTKMTKKLLIVFRHKSSVHDQMDWGKAGASVNEFTRDKSQGHETGYRKEKKSRHLKGPISARSCSQPICDDFFHCERNWTKKTVEKKNCGAERPLCQACLHQFHESLWLSPAGSRRPIQAVLVANSRDRFLRYCVFFSAINSAAWRQITNSTNSKGFSEKDTLCYKYALTAAFMLQICINRSVGLNVFYICHCLPGSKLLVNNSKIRR